jgi:membrane-bound ClpP family serine protease
MLADPWLAGFLVFVGFFALMVEAKSPGIGAGAFIACICFLLFFWGQILEGNAGYLEVLLFIMGVICVAMEIFILPGFGIFGIGGGLLIIFSLILASQTFVIPRNLYELQQLPTSLFTVIAAMMGVLAAIWIVGRYLPHTPYLSNMVLKPVAGETAETIARREQLADFTHLVGKGGQTTTPLVPAGKARIGDDVIDVLSEGDLIPRGVKVVVVEALGNRVVVRQAADE